MCKKACLLISLVFVLSLLNTQPAYSGLVWWSDQNPNDHLWSSEGNWLHWDESDQDFVDGNEPNSLDTVYIGKGVGEADWPKILYTYTIDPTPVIEPNSVASCYALWGPGGSYEEGLGWWYYLDILGGSLTIGDMNAPEYSTRWEIAGTTGEGEVNMDGGVVNVAGEMTIGSWDGIGVVNMTGGEINVKFALCMPGVDSGDGENCEAEGTLNLSGGTIRCGGLYLNEWVTFSDDYDWMSEWMSTSTREPITGRPSTILLSTIDLAGGTLIIDGSYGEHIARFVANGYMTIYGMEEGDITPDGRRAYVKVDYDAESDTTTVMGATVDPNCAYEPDPVHYAKDLPVNTVLDWSEGDNTIAHDIYIGTSFDDVSNADTSDLSGIYKDRQGNDPNVGGGSIYVPDELWEMDTTYYWRIDEFDGVNVWRGRVWCFSIGNYYSVDDFDSYADDYALKAVWNDSQVNNTGSQISIQDSEDFAPAGNELQFYYNNRVQVDGICVGSVADVNTPALGISPDWTTDGLTTSLGLYFYGNAKNSATENDQMYAAIKDTNGTIGVVPYDGEPSDILEPEWHEWPLDLQRFVDLGVDVTDVANFSIGFGGPATGQTERGGNGTVYFNNIRLYTTRCVPEKVIAIADLTGDCVVNLEDFEIMAGDWLLSDSSIAVDIPPAPQLWYRFDEGTGTTIHNDGELFGLDGIFPFYDPEWVTPGAPAVDALEPNFAMYFDGDDDYVEIGYSPELSLNDFTVSAWVKLATEPYGDGYGILGTRVGGENTFDLKVQEAKIHGDIGDGTEWINIYIDIRAEDTGANGQGGDLDLDTWYMITYVIDNTNQEARLYLDGDFKKSIAISGTPLLMKSEQKMWIGQTGYPGEVMDGLIDDVRIYKQALSQAEILYLMGAEGTVFFPVPSPANITDPEPPLSRKVNLADFAIVAGHWLEEILWP